MNRKLEIPSAHASDIAASTWMARSDKGLSASEKAEFDAWLAADAGNRRAWHRIESAWSALDRPRLNGLEDFFAQELIVRRNRRRRRTAGWVAGIAAAAVVAFLLSLLPVKSWNRGNSIAHGGTPVPLLKADRRELSDGSVVDLNLGADIAVEFGDARRVVRLIRGEARFSVAADPGRPFVVMAGTVEVRAIGTVFSVRVDDQAVDVLVTQGRVAVSEFASAAPSHPEDPSPIVVDAGRRVLMEAIPPARQSIAPQAVAVAPAEIERRLAWLGPRLDLSGTPLADAVATLNRENRVQLSITDPELARMKLSGVFRADDAEGFADVLSSHYGVVSERAGADRIFLRSR